MAGFRSSVIAGDPWTTTLALSGGPFVGTETLVGSVVTGTGEAAIVSPSVTWTAGQLAGAYTLATITLSIAQTTLLPPGGYVVQVSISGSSALAWGVLAVHPGVGTSPVLRSLITPGQALIIAPDLADTQADLDGLSSLLAAATRTIEHYCRRQLVLGTIDRIFRPARTRRIYLTSWPVAPGPRVSTEWMPAIAITNIAPLAYPVATASWTPAVAGQFTPSTLTLATVDSTGVALSVPIAISGTPTIQDLANAINAVGSGWQALLSGAIQGGTLASRPAADLLCDLGQHGCSGQSYEVGLYSRDVARYNLNPLTGVLELTENRPDSFRYPDRTWGGVWGGSWSVAADPRYAGVRVTYQAGYAVLAADITAGLEAVPEDLQTACVMVAH